MSDTPRTDQRAFKAAFLPPEAIVTADFARELERELAQRTADLAKANAERDEARRSCCEYAAIVDGADTTEGMESGRFYERAMKYMKDRGWDCFKEDGK